MFAAGNDKVTHAFNPFPMSGHARHPAAPRPAAIAIHDDRDVPWRIAKGRRRRLLAGGG
jgi:hypothetical protein